METEKYIKEQNRRDKATLIGVSVYVVMSLIGLLILMLCNSCTTPKVTDVHHHHYASADTTAIQAVVDSRLQVVREQMEHSLYAAVTQQMTEQESQEQEKERVTETITTWVDSLGRQMRQEQRTTERDISRQQQLREQRIQQQWENRMKTVLDSVNRQWDEKFNMMKGRWEENDSTDIHQEPAPGDNRPWYKRWWDAMKWMLLGAIIFAVGWFTRKLWLPWLRLLT